MTNSAVFSEERAGSEQIPTALIQGSSPSQGGCTELDHIFYSPLYNLLRHTLLTFDLLIPLFL